MRGCPDSMQGGLHWPTLCPSPPTRPEPPVKKRKKEDPYGPESAEFFSGGKGWCVGAMGAAPAAAAWRMRGQGRGRD